MGGWILSMLLWTLHLGKNEMESLTLLRRFSLGPFSHCRWYVKLHDL